MITDENVQATPVDPTEQALSRLVITASADAVFGEPVVNGEYYSHSLFRGCHWLGYGFWRWTNG